MPAKSLPEPRFFDKISPEPNSGCWLWTGRVSIKGYGGFQFRGDWWQAHRASYEMFIGHIPSGLFVCHKCDTPGCVNPEHLFTGTNQENILDAKKKGRLPAGKNNIKYGDKMPGSSLTADDIRAIRSSTEKYRILAARYGVTMICIKFIRWRRRWKHV